MGNSVKKRLTAGLCILALVVGVFFGNSVQPPMPRANFLHCMWKERSYVTRKARWCSCAVSAHTDFPGIRNM